MNIFGFALAAFKDFILHDIKIGSIAIQTWMLIALAIVVVLAVLVAISAVKNSKRKGGEAEQEPADGQTEDACEDATNAEKTTEESTEEKPVAEEAQPEEAEETPQEEKTEEETEEKPVEEKSEEEAVASVEEETEEPTEEKPEDVPTEEKEKEATVVEEAQAEEAEEAPQEEKTEEETEEKPEEETVEENKEEEETAKPETSAEEETAATVEEETEKKPTKAAKSTVKKPAEEDNMKEKPAKKTETKTAKTAKTEDKKTAKKPAAKTVAEEPAKSAVGKYEICNSSIGGFRYHLLANNGQLLYESRDYKSYDACNEAISKFINSVENGTFTVRADKFGNYKYHLKSATSNNIIYIGESYTSKKAALNSIDSVKRFASAAPVVDATDANFEVSTTAFEIPDDIKKAVSKKQGAVGKWQIEKVDPEDSNSSYVFLLFANNGQLLYESREYASAAGCKKGIEAFVSTVEEGYFIVDEDKFGRYKFFLRSNKAGSQAEYVGPNYTDKSSCCGSAVSVYKFALLTPVALD